MFNKHWFLCLPVQSGLGLAFANVHARGWGQKKLPAASSFLFSALRVAGTESYHSSDWLDLSVFLKRQVQLSLSPLLRKT